MIIVRNTFTAKPGQAGKLAAHLKEVAGLGNLPDFRVLTDLTGEFNSVVLEYQLESVSAFEETMSRYIKDPSIREKAAAYLDLWSTGNRQLLRVV